VHRIVPLMSARVVVKFRGEVRDKIVARWRRVANEANGQSRRTTTSSSTNRCTCVTSQ